VGELWEQQPGESRLWYTRFRAWLVDPRRSLLGVYRAEWEAQVSKKAGKGGKRRDFRAKGVPGSWQKTIQQWRWAERAAAYDAHLDALGGDLVARALRELRGEAPAIARKLATDGVNGALNREQIRAAMAVLDRAGLSPTAKHEITGLDGGRLTLTLRWNDDADASDDA